LDIFSNRGISRQNSPSISLNWIKKSLVSIVEVLSFIALGVRYKFISSLLLSRFWFG